MWNETQNCPVCKTKLLKVGLRNHIIGRAKVELWRLYFKESDKVEHLKYVSQNTETVELKIIRLKLK